MSEPTSPPTTSEAPDNDFPYYNGLPVYISMAQWLFVIFMVVLGFAILIAPIPLFANKYGQFIPAILFFAIPLLGLALVAPKHWREIFRRIRGWDIAWMVGIAILNIGVTLVVGSLVVKLSGANPNPAVNKLAIASTVERILFFLKTIPQLFGEEILTILPFLALMTLFTSQMKMSRKQAILAAWLLSAILFGLAHLPAYQWNFIQCVVIIGSARIVLLIAYLCTKNIWVSTGAHILNDWIIFGIALLDPAPSAG